MTLLPRILLVQVLLTPMMVGCYDSAGLVERARGHAVRTRLEEIDLGRYFVTRPRDLASGEVVEVQLHVFGTLPHYQLKQVGRELEAQEHVVRHRVILTLREAPDRELSDPGLAALTERLLRVINDSLPNAPIEALGFYEVRFTRS